jgi:hypothetical protein
MSAGEDTDSIEFMRILYRNLIKSTENEMFASKDLESKVVYKI